MSNIGQIIFSGFFPKGNQIIRSTQKTTTSNLTAIQPTVHKISRPQAFWPFFSKNPLSAILFLIFFSQKLIRSSELPKEPQHQIWMRSNQRFRCYRAHKLFGRIFFQTQTQAQMHLFGRKYKTYNFLGRYSVRATHEINKKTCIFL